MSKTKRWLRQITNIIGTIMVLWLVFSTLEIGLADCATIGRDYSAINIFCLLLKAL